MAPVADNDVPIDEVAHQGIAFDHVAVAVERITDPWPTLAHALGGRYLDRGINPGFGWTQVRFANGFVVEGLHPEDIDQNDFLHRFLARSGAGPHHLTFTVPDLAALLQVVRDGGIEPVGESFDDPAWAEAFLHPNDAHGIVVQLAQVGSDPIPTPPEPEGFPDLPYDKPVASLGRVVHAVADLEGALGLFRDLLGGQEMSNGSALDGNHWVELRWRGPGRLRLLEATHAEIAEWIGDRPGRLRHLYFDFDEPTHVPGATRVAEGRWVIEADNVLGTRMVISSAAR